jgi:phosphoserine aminotransferase
VNVVATSADKNFSYAPAQDAWKLNPDAAYVHYTSNETIGGVEMFWTPNVGAVPLVADMSSHILSRPVDVARHALIYAGAQKNIGPAGLTIVIVRDDMIGETVAGTPSMYDYKIHAENESMYNTPPTFAIYVAGLVFKWLKANGGLAAMEKINITKANMLYDYLDSTSFFNCPTAKENRSRMNIPFTLKDEALDEAFLKGAKDKGLLQLKGHRSVGGMRASIYNAMPTEGVRVLVEYMKAFEKANS